jgi:hypothetical protein
MNRQHEAHQLVVRIEPVDSRFSCLIEEPGLEEPHYVMSGPPLSYDEAVDDLVRALKEHLLARGDRV